MTSQHNISPNELVHLIIYNQASGQEVFKKHSDTLYEKVAESLIYEQDSIGTYYCVLESKRGKK